MGTKEVYMSVENYNKEDNTNLLTLCAVLNMILNYIQVIYMQDCKELGKKDKKYIEEIKNSTISFFYAFLYHKFDSLGDNPEEFLKEFTENAKKDFENEEIKNNLDNFAQWSLEKIGQDYLIKKIDSLDFKLAEKIALLDFILLNRNIMLDSIIHYFGESFAEDIIITIESKFWNKYGDTEFKDMEWKFDKLMKEYFEGLVEYNNLLIRMTNLEKLGYNSEYNEEELRLLAYNICFDFVDVSEDVDKQAKYVSKKMGISRRRYYKISKEICER